MNRLANSRAYLCGAMEREADNGVGWRQEIVRQLADLGICWLDPCRKPTDLAEESDATRRRWATARKEGL